MQIDAGQENAQRAQDKNITNCCQLTNRLLVGSAHSNISHFLIEDDVFFFYFLRWYCNTHCNTEKNSHCCLTLDTPISHR